MNAVAGRRPTQKMEPFRFDQMRPSCYDVDARVARHGHQRHVGGGELPVDDHRVLRPGVLQRQGPRARPGVHPRRGTTGCSRSGTSRTRPASSRSASRSSPIPTSRSPRSTATPSAASPASACRNARTSSGCPTCGSATTGTRSSRRASTPTPSSRCTSAARAAPMGPPGAPASAARRHAVRPAVAHVVRRVALVRVPGEAPDAQDRDERGRHRLGRDAARPARQHHRPLGLRRRVGRPARRRR